VQAIIDRVRCDPACSERIVTEKFPNIRDFGANSSLKDHPVKVWNDNDESSPLSRFGNCINWKKLYERLCSLKAGSRGNHSVSVGFSSGLNTKDPCPLTNVNLPKVNLETEDFIHNMEVLDALLHCYLQGTDPDQPLTQSFEELLKAGGKAAFRRLSFPSSSRFGSPHLKLEAGTFAIGEEVFAHYDLENCPENELVLVLSRYYKGVRISCILYFRKSVLDAMTRIELAQATARNVEGMLKGTKEDPPLPCSLLLPDAGYYPRISPALQYCRQREEKNIQDYLMNYRAELGIYLGVFSVARPSGNKVCTYRSGVAHVISRCMEKFSLSIEEVAELLLVANWTTTPHKFVAVVESWLRDGTFPQSGEQSIVERVIKDACDIFPDGGYCTGTFARHTVSFTKPYPKAKVRQSLETIRDVLLELSSVELDAQRDADTIPGDRRRSREVTNPTRTVLREIKSLLGVPKEICHQQAFYKLTALLQTRCYNVGPLAVHHLMADMINIRGIDYPLLLSYASFAKSTASGREKHNGASSTGMEEDNEGHCMDAALSLSRAVSLTLNVNQAFVEHLSCESMRSKAVVELHFQGHPLYFRSFSEQCYQMTKFWLDGENTLQREAVPLFAAKLSPDRRSKLWSVSDEGGPTLPNSYPAAFSGTRQKSFKAQLCALAKRDSRIVAVFRSDEGRQSWMAKDIAAAKCASNEVHPFSGPGVRYVPVSEIYKMVSRKGPPGKNTLTDDEWKLLARQLYENSGRSLAFSGMGQDEVRFGPRKLSELWERRPGGSHALVNMVPTAAPKKRRRQQKKKDNMETQPQKSLKRKSAQVAHPSPGLDDQVELPYGTKPIPDYVSFGDIIDYAPYIASGKVRYCMPRLSDLASAALGLAAKKQQLLPKRDIKVTTIGSAQHVPSMSDLSFNYCDDINNDRITRQRYQKSVRHLAGLFGGTVRNGEGEDGLVLFPSKQSAYNYFCLCTFLFVLKDPAVMNDYLTKLYNKAGGTTNSWEHRLLRIKFARLDSTLVLLVRDSGNGVHAVVLDQSTSRSVVHIRIGTLSRKTLDESPEVGGAPSEKKRARTRN